MDEKYLQDLYEWIKSNDPSYGGRYDYSQFIQKMQDDQYASQMHKWISGIDETFEQRRPLNNFLQLVKKKESGLVQPSIQVSEEQESVSPSDQSSSVSQSPSFYSQLPQAGMQQGPPMRPAEQMEPDYTKMADIEQATLGAVKQPQEGQFPYKIEEKPKDILKEQMFEEMRKERKEGTEGVPKFLAEQYKEITPNFLNRNVDVISKDLQYAFGDAGFDFEKGVNGVKVIAPNGKEKYINIYYSLGQGQNYLEDNANELKQFIKDNAVSVGADEMIRLQKEYNEGRKKFLNEQQIKEEFKNLNEDAESLKNEINNTFQEETTLSELQNKINLFPENQRNTAAYQSLVNDYNSRLESFNINKSELDKKIKQSEARNANLQKAAGEYVKNKSEQGGLLGAMWNRLTDNTGSIIAGLYNNLIDFHIERSGNISGLMSNEKFEKLFNEKLKEKGYSEGADISESERKSIIQEIDAEQRDKLKKGLKYGKVDDIEFFKSNPTESVRQFFREKFGTLNTTEEYIQKLEKEGNIVQKGLIGTAGSIPALIGPPMFRVMNMYNMVTDGVSKEMENDPDFKNISENEKQMVKIPIGIVGAALEEFGFRNLLKGKSIITDITKRVIGKVPVGATASQIRSAALSEIKEMGLRGGLALVGAGLAEAETGGAQQISEFAIKDIYNAMKGKKMFDTPIMFSQEYFEKIAEASATEAVGGFVMGVPNAISSAFEKDGFQGLSDDTFLMFEELSKSSDSKKLFAINLKNKINEGKITKAQAEKILDNYNNSVGLNSQILDDITDVGDRKKAMDLLVERKKLGDKKQGKDDALAKPIQDRIDAINNELTKISQDAIQKQAASQISLQPETGVGEEVVEGKPKPKPEVTPSQGVLSPEEKEKITQNRRVDLFPEESEFADAIGGSGRNSNLSDYNEVNGIGIASYTNPDNGLVDVIMSGTSDNDYVGYVRVYENGKPTNRWTSKMSNESGNKGNFKTMISEVQSRLPENHEYTETTNISIDGVRVYSNQLDRGYEILTDENGNPVTNTVTLNAATVQGLQEATTQEEKQSLYDNMIVNTREQFNELKDKITSLMPNVRVLWNQANNTVQLQLPVLVQSTKTKKEPTAIAEEVTVAEAAPVEQFTEQDRARQQELTDALAKADKRRKNVIVGETTMSKADVKAELDALNQKEQASQKPAPATEATPAERTPEQEADLLEELMSGKKKEPVVEEVAPEEKPKGDKLAEAIRKNLKIKGPQGLQSNVLGVPIAIWNAGVETVAKSIEVGMAVNDAIKRGINYIKEKHGKKINEASVEKKMLIGIYAEAIKTAREAGVSNDGIKTYLERKGVTEEQIDTLLKYKERAEKKAPTAEKVVGKPKPKKVTVNEMSALKDQIRLEAKAAREAKGDLNAKRKQLAAAINAMAKSGVMTARQAETIIRRVNTVNLDNPDMVERLLDYADKVFKDAEYASKLKNAKKLQSEAKSLSKNKEKNAEVRELAKEFGKIDPSMVDNIDEYIEMASEVVEGIKGSRLTAKGVSLASAVDINKTKKYIDKTLENQAEKQREMMAAKMQDLMGVDVSDLSYDQMIQLLDSDKPIDKYKEGIIRDTISRMFDTYSTIIESMFKTGKNPFDISEDAETIEFKDSQKELVRNFMSIDLNTLTPREALMAVDALNNFIVNGSTANMETVYRNYLGTKNAKTVKDKGIKGKPLSFLFIKSLGRFFLEEFVSLPLLIESMFKSQVTALYFSKMMGLNDLSNSASQATSITQKAVSNYLKQFSSLKPNKKAFNDAYNATERGMLAFMTRNIIGTEAEMKKEFEYRKRLIEESTKELSEGSTKEQEKAKLYQEAYDKILKDSKDAQEVKQKTDKINADAVDWWINEWSKHYNDMSDVALNVYNKVLEKDLNYTTDRYARLEMAPKDKSELESNASAYFFNNGTMYKKEAGALKETVDKTGELPKNKDGEVTRYVDLSFDSVQASSLYDAMSDIKTAGAIRQVESFLKSKDLKKVFTPEDLKLLTDRVNLAIRNIRSQVNYDSSELNKLVKNLDRFAKFSATLALAGVTQPFKQTIPLMFNTLINAGQFDPFGVTFNKSIREFINNSGRAIANRGVESQVYIESINRLIDQAATSPPEKAAKFIEKANDLWMKTFLANPDAYIAKASWMAYYEQSLKKQKINTKGIDYATHKLNEEAADYAQMMVDRQQNITDTRLAGAMYSDTKGGAYKKLITRLFLPLASFRLNQYFRTKSDLATLFSKSNTFQDKVKAARSLTGLAVEQMIFKSLVIGFGLTYHYISDAIIAAFTGDEEDEEEKEKKWKIRQDNLLKGQATSAVTDLFSPLPAFDPLVKYGANTALDVTQELLDVADENKLSIFVDDPKKVKTYSDAAGMYGIGIDKVSEILKTGYLAYSGKHTDNYGNEKYITKEQQDLLKWSLIPSVILNTGVLPGAPEFNNIMGKVKKDIMYSGKTKNQLEESSAFRDYGSRKEFEKAEPQEYLKAKNTPGDPLYELNKKEKEARDKKKEEEGEVPSGKVSRKPREFGRGKKSSDLRKPREGGR